MIPLCVGARNEIYAIFTIYVSKMRVIKNILSLKSSLFYKGQNIDFPEMYMMVFLVSWLPNKSSLRSAKPKKYA